MLTTVFALLMVVANGSAQFNSSCVQIVNSGDGVSPYPDDEPSLAFTIEGATNLKTNTVNIVIAVDGSKSIDPDDWILEQQFAKDTVGAFAKRNIFENGGTASYVQFGDSTYDEGTFDSVETFNSHVDAVNQSYYQPGGRLGTRIGASLSVCAALMNANDSSFGFVILVTDGESFPASDDPISTAERIRADNTTNIFAVGVGSSISSETLLGIAGKEENVFGVVDFASLAAAVADIDVIADETILSCPATGVTITVEFNASVRSAGSSGATTTGAVISGDTRVTFTADDLEDNPSLFAVSLEDCGEVAFVEYEDNQGNSPDFSSLPDPTCNEVLVYVGFGLRPSYAPQTLAMLPSPRDKEQPPSRGIVFASGSMEADIKKNGDNPAGWASADDDIAEWLSGSRGAGEAAVTGDIPPDSTISPRNLQEGGGRGTHPSPETPVLGHGSTIINTEVVNGATNDTPAGGGAVAGDAPAGDENGQMALLLAVGSLPSIRSPSSTLVWLMVVQVQFLAVLSLVDSVGSENSWLSDFLEYLRWFNFWVPIGSDSDDDTLVEKNNDISEEDFVGNIVMFWCIGLLILVLHLVLVSAIEAYWLQATKESEDSTEARTDFRGEPLRPDRGEVTGSTGGDMTDPAPTHGEMHEIYAGRAGGGGAAKRLPELEPVTKCREHSKSIWIHFPHVELVFLLYAAQGSLATQLEVLRHGEGVILVVAAIALTKKDNFSTTSGRHCRSFFSRVTKGLKEQHSSFAWAKKGDWMTAYTGDPEKLRLGDWFRIGFEPLFADFTQSGSWFAVYTLLESYIVACIGVLLDSSSQLQLLLFMGLNVAGFCVVACLKPFANRVVDIIAACRLGFNAVCMALLVVSEAEGVTSQARRLETAVGVMEVLFLLLG
eukprot:g13628.t1